jgi:hypothetical protein
MPPGILICPETTLPPSVVPATDRGSTPGPESSAQQVLSGMVSQERNMKDEKINTRNVLAWCLYLVIDNPSIFMFMHNMNREMKVREMKVRGIKVREMKVREMKMLLQTGRCRLHGGSKMNF